jgi:hypothetical protein
MYVNDNHFDGWMEKLSKKLSEIGRDLKSLIHTNDVFDKDEKLLDNQDLCLMLHVSPRTLQRYRSEGVLPFIKYGQKIYYKAAESHIRIIIPFWIRFELILLFSLLFQKNTLHLLTFTQSEQYKIFIAKNRHFILIVHIILKKKRARSDYVPSSMFLG